MERLNVELTTEASRTAGAEFDKGETATSLNPYGKFKDAESLLKAYESLQSEFTRRSQRLKAIEGELKNRSQEEKTVEKAEGSIIDEEGFKGRYPNSSQFEKEIESEVKNNSYSFEQAYIKILERQLGEMKNKPIEKEQYATFEKDFSQIVIKEYLKKIMQEKPKNKSFSGAFLTTPPLKPTTVAEASAIAKHYIKRKGE